MPYARPFQPKKRCRQKTVPSYPFTYFFIEDMIVRSIIKNGAVIPVHLFLEGFY